MWENLPALATAALVTVAGPVSIASLWRKGRVWENYEQLVPLYERYSQSGAFEQITRPLDDAWISDGEQSSILEFVNAQEGRLLLRSVAANSVGTVSGAPPEHIREALVIQARALIVLYSRRKSTINAEVAAPILVEAFIRLVDDLYSRMGEGNYRLATDIRNQALSARRRPYILTPASVRKRGEAQGDLTTELEDDFQNEVQDYIAHVADFTDKISVPTLRGGIPLPLKKIRVSPRFTTAEQLGGTERYVNQIGDPLLRILESKSCVVILGDPGGGKSTAVQAAMNELSHVANDVDHAAVPFRIILRNFSAAIDEDPRIGVIRFLHSTLPGSDDVSCMNLATVRYLFHTGRAVLFFDGLDEILAYEKREIVMERIDRFVSNFDSSAYVVTCRRVDYEERPLGTGFHQVVVPAFSEQDVERFVGEVLPLISDMSKADAALFMEQSAVIADVRSNPLMLGVLCNLFATGRRMPANRRDVYAKCAEMLFTEWDGRRGTVATVADQENTESATKEMALAMFREGKEEFPESWLQRYLEDYHLRTLGSNLAAAERFAGEALKLWRGRKWLLVFVGTRDGVDYYRFTHRTFLEYFAAQQLVFESVDGSALWNEIAKLVGSRTANLFCLLSVQMLSERTKGAADGVLMSALKTAGIAAGRGALREAYHTTFFCCETLASIRSTAAVRTDVTRLALRLFSQLVPWTTPDEARQSESELRTMGYRDVFEDSVGAEDLSADGIDLSDDPMVDGIDRGDEGGSIGSISRMFASLANLTDLERSVHIDVIFEEARSILDADWGLGSRAVLALRQMPRFEEWSDIDSQFRNQLSTMADELWSMVVTGGYLARRDGPIDYWLVLALLRDGCEVPAAVLYELEIDDLFVAGWPLPVIGFGGTTLAHRLVTSILAISTSEPDWHPRLCDSLVNHFAELIATAELPWTNERLRGIGDFEPSKNSVLSVVAERQTLREDELLLVIFLLVCLTKMNDEPFVRSVLAAVGSRALADKLEAVVDVVMYPALWDEENDALAAAGFSSTTREELLNALGETRLFGFS